MERLFGYYSWHMDELLTLYNALAGTDYRETDKLHLEQDKQAVYFWIEGGRTFYLPMSREN